MKSLLITVALLAASPVAAEDAKPLTTEQCIGILTGLKALDCAGEQLGGSCAAEAKQYKLGDARITISWDIQALSPVLTSYQRAQQQFALELPPIPATEPGKPAPPETAPMQAEQNKKMFANQVAMLGHECNVAPAHLKLSELRLGDDADHNAIPPSVLAAFAPIIDRDK